MTKVSIITISYNNYSGLLRTIASVSNQSASEIEHIIIDGGTLGFNKNEVNNLKKFPGAIISEPDLGIYDAMNKGISFSSGEYLCFLNSEDVYFDNRVMERYIKFIENKEKPVAVYANLIFVADKKIKREWRAGKFYRINFLFGWMMPHPTILAKKELFSPDATFDLTLTVAADYDWMLRNFYFIKNQPLYLNETTIVMQAGGVSNASLTAVFKANLEVLKSWRKYKSCVPFWLFILKPISKLRQLF